MIRFLILVICLLPCAFAIAQNAAGESKIFPYTINQVTLDNGLKIISVPFDSKGIVAYYTVVRTGSRNEAEAGKSGFAHFFEHMMFRGTEKYPKEKFTDVLKTIGADNNAYTSDDRTVYHTVASADALEQIMDLESDRFMHLKYTEEDFKTESGAILGEYNKNSSSPFSMIFEKIRDAAYTQHTYKHTTMGFLEDIKNMPNQYEYSIKFFDRWYRPENCVVLVVGDFNQEKLIALAKKYYGDWKRGSYTLDVPKEPPQTAEKNVDLPWKSRTLPILAMAYHGPAFSDTEKDLAALNLMALLNFGETSDLYRKLYVEKQMVEFVEGQMDESRDPGLFYVFSRVKDPNNIDAVKQAILQTLEDAKTKPVSAERLNAIKSHVKYDFAMSLNNPDRVANILAVYISLTGDPQTVNRLYATYEGVTAGDIMAAAQKYFSPENRTTLLLTQQKTQEVNK